MYSRKRLAVIALAWGVAAVVVFGVAPHFGADADPRGCDSPRCAFPAENNIGGIVLGTDFLEGQGLISFGVGEDPAFTDRTPPGRVEPREENIGLGINDVTASRFFIYKQWYYFDERVGAQVPVHVWANATQATLTGSPECGSGSQGWGGSTNCDLVANTSELSSRYIWASTNCVSGGFLCDLFAPNTLEIDSYHAVNVENDDCGVLGALGGQVCLGLIQDGASCFIGICVESDDVEAYDLQIRGHEFKALPGPDDGGATKQLSLDNAYIEMRYGTGYDRIYSPQSNPDTSSANGNYDSVVGSNPDWAQPTQGSSGTAALGVNFECQGGGPTTFCAIQSGRNQNREGESYDNIYE